jgi:hypothetical protein
VGSASKKRWAALLNQKCFSSATKTMVCTLLSSISETHAEEEQTIRPRRKSPLVGDALFLCTQVANSYTDLTKTTGGDLRAAASWNLL